MLVGAMIVVWIIEIAAILVAILGAMWHVIWLVICIVPLVSPPTATISVRGPLRVGASWCTSGGATSVIISTHG